MFVLMTAATFIDFDEQTIPDIITTPGTWFALDCQHAALVDLVAQRSILERPVWNGRNHFQCAVAV